MPYWHYPCAHFHSLFPFSKHISSHWPESHEPCLFILLPIANTLLSPYISPVHSSAPALLGKISLAKFILAAIYCSLWGRLVTLVTSQQFCCQSKLEKWSNSCVLSKEDLQKDNNEVGITSTQKKKQRTGETLHLSPNCLSSHPKSMPCSLFMCSVQELSYPSVAEEWIGSSSCVVGALVWRKSKKNLC